MNQRGQVVSRNGSRLRLILLLSLTLGVGAVVDRLATGHDIVPLESKANAVPRPTWERPPWPPSHRASAVAEAPEIEKAPRIPLGPPVSSENAANQAGKHPDPALDMAADRQRHKAAHERAIVDHRTEAVREPWASQMAAGLRADFQKLAPDGAFQLIDSTCRSTTCLSTLEWPNYGVALQQWPSVLHYSYASLCGIEVFLDEPASADAAYRSTVLTTCPNPPISQPAAGARP